MQAVKALMSKALMVTAAVLLIAGCNETGPTNGDGTSISGSEPKTINAFRGTVAETMDTGGYTYVRVTSGEQEMWAAAPEFKVAVGDLVIVPEGMPMANFHSATLDRDFERIYFVAEVRLEGLDGQPALEELPSGHPEVAGGAATSQPTSRPAAGELPAGHPAVSGTPTSQPAVADAIDPGDGGHSIASVFAKSAELSGTQVQVRGRVVKYNPGIMGRNWIHIQDGSGEAGTNDLTVTTSSSVKVGDVVTARGKLSLDRDFGMGYRYDLIIEDATVTVD